MVASRTAALRRFFSSRPVFSCKKKCRSLKEEAQAALIQVASEKQAALHGSCCQLAEEECCWCETGGCSLPETGGCILNVAEDTMRDCDFRSLSQSFSQHFIFAASGAAESAG